jgi:UDP-N-acetylmuramate dehydrogenase
VPLAPLSTLGVGGEAKWYVRADTIEDVAAAHRWSAERNLPLFVLGGGSNLVIADEGIDGLVLHVALRGVSFTQRGEETVVRVGAGEPWDDIVGATVARGLAGFECLSGIPGSAGGTPIQNVGAYGQEVAGALQDVTAFDRQAGQVVMLSAGDCRFGYRTSRFKHDEPGRFMVCEVTFRLRQGPPTVTYPDVVAYLERSAITAPSVADVRHAVLAIRRQKAMVIDPADPDTRSVGSFFMNPVVARAAYERIASVTSGPVPRFAMPDGDVKIPAAWLIEQAGFSRGHGSGPAGISSKHPLAIVNRGGATARNVLELAAQIKRQVGERFGIWLRPEPVFMGFRNDDTEVSFLCDKRGG